MNLSNIPTCELVKELVTREGVIEFQINPYDDYEIISRDELLYDDDGPSRILVVID